MLTRMSAATAKAGRAKLSTTVSPKTLEFLEEKVASRQASSIAQAVDAAIEKVRRLENRQRLAAATARYFDQMEAQAAAEEGAIAHDLAAVASAIDFDNQL
jgi:inosine-uridine nucleoside N-ribohydrolase